ncbi:MAG: hypothetical protein OK438_01240 [Thaumarchaeota archaeon]|nr:hypothetical protein [Nitrososphaerota archaeon]
MSVSAAVLIVLLVVALAVFAANPHASQVSSNTTVQTGCPSTTNSSGNVTAPNPSYDVQELMGFAQSYSRLEVNVTAVAQCDANGYGPAYLLNGLSNTGYWYQVGINWNWPLQTGGYSPGFGFVSETWAPGGLTRAPATSALTGTVNNGDTVELSLSFTGGRLVAFAHDLNTGANGSSSYPARAATIFVGTEAQQSHSRFSFATQGYFTGLMTEWYHVNASENGVEQKVTYSENTTAIASATLGVGEWNFTVPAPSSVFTAAANNGNPIDLGAKPYQLQQFTLNGYTVTADAYEFSTGRP